MTLTREAFAGTTMAKSDQVNAVDLLGGPLVCQITDIQMTGSADQPISIYIDSHPQPWKPSKTFRRVLLRAWPDTEPAEWVGRYAVIWCDPDIKWAGEKVGGVAISHLSHIGERKIFVLAESKSKRKTIVVDPYHLQDSTQQPPQEPVYWPDDAFAKRLDAATPKLQSGELTVDQFVEAMEKKAPITAGQRARAESAATPVVAEHADEGLPPPVEDEDVFSE